MRTANMRVGVTGNGTGYIVHLRDGRDTVWVSDRVRLDLASAEGFMSDLRDALRNTTCRWCGEGDTEISDFGNLDTDPSDISAWCDNEYCVAARNQETRDLERMEL